MKRGRGAHPAFDLDWRTMLREILLTPALELDLNPPECPIHRTWGIFMNALETHSRKEAQDFLRS